MPPNPSGPHHALAIGRGLPLERAELSRLLSGHLDGWEEIPHDSRLSAGEEVYPVLGDQKCDVQPCVITHAGTLKELLVGLDREPLRVFRRVRMPAQPADRPAATARVVGGNESGR